MNEVGLRVARYCRDSCMECSLSKHNAASDACIPFVSLCPVGASNTKGVNQCMVRYTSPEG